MDALYGTVASWIAYAAARGDSAPSAATSADQHLQVGSDYIRHNYVSRFAPSIDLAAADIALALEEASYLAASMDLASPGSLSSTFSAGSQKVLSKVGELEWTVPEHEGVSAADLAITRNTSIERLLAPYLASGVDGAADSATTASSAFFGVA